MFNETSDDFFRFDASAVLTEPVDLVFIDGLHLFEYALRDFMNIERYCTRDSLVVFDDVLPNHPVQARRDRASMAWCGDVWRIADCLAAYRPDLALLVLDTAPTGLLLVCGLDPDSKVLWDAYDEIMARYVDADDLGDPPASVLDRTAAVDPESAAVTELVQRLRDRRG